MARKKRYSIPGGFYHVMLRGNGGQNIFFDDFDRCKLCLLLQEGIERFKHRIHSFCFMSNHIHLLIELGNESLSKIVQNFAFRYSFHINKKFQKEGHLFQGRYKSILLQKDWYFLKLLRYIHLNPVRAGIVKKPAEYLWSSYTTFLGDGKYPWITTNYALKAFGDTLEEARYLYRNYMHEIEFPEDLDEIRKGFTDGQILGDDDFYEQVRQICDIKREQTSLSIGIILDGICKFFGVSLEELQSQQRTRRISRSRGAVAYLISREETGITLSEVATIFNRDVSSICSLAKRFEQCMHNDQELMKQIEELRFNLQKTAKAQTHTL